MPVSPKSPAQNGGADNSKHEQGLIGWSIAQRTTPMGRSYNVYFGPRGEYAESRRQALLLASGNMKNGLQVAPKTPNASKQQARQQVPRSRQPQPTGASRKCGGAIGSEYKPRDDVGRSAARGALSGSASALSRARARAALPPPLPVVDVTECFVALKSEEVVVETKETAETMEVDAAAGTVVKTEVKSAAAAEVSDAVPSDAVGTPGDMAEGGAVSANECEAACALLMGLSEAGEGSQLSRPSSASCASDGEPKSRPRCGGSIGGSRSRRKEEALSTGSRVGAAYQADEVAWQAVDDGNDGEGGDGDGGVGDTGVDGEEEDANGLQSGGDRGRGVKARRAREGVRVFCPDQLPEEFVEAYVKRAAEVVAAAAAGGGVACGVGDGDGGGGGGGGGGRGGGGGGVGATAGEGGPDGDGCQVRASGAALGAGGAAATDASVTAARGGACVGRKRPRGDVVEAAVHEAALRVLHEYAYDRPAALRALASGREAPVRTRWSAAEALAFDSGLCSYGKDFAKMREALPEKTTGQIVQYYYERKPCAMLRSGPPSFLAAHPVVMRAQCRGDIGSLAMCDHGRGVGHDGEHDGGHNGGGDDDANVLAPPPTLAQPSPSPSLSTREASSCKDRGQPAARRTDGHGATSPSVRLVARTTLNEKSDWQVQAQLLLHTEGSDSSRPPLHETRVFAHIPPQPRAQQVQMAACSASVEGELETCPPPPAECG